jgi:hypothetical protein
MYLRHKLAQWYLPLTIIGTTPTWAAPFNPPTPTLKANGHLICAGGKLDPTRLAMFYFTNDKVAEAFPAGLGDFMAALGAPDSRQGQQRTIADAIEAQVQIMIGLPSSGFQIVTPQYTRDVPNFFSATSSQLVVNCNKNNAPGAPSTPAAEPPPHSAATPTPTPTPTPAPAPPSQAAPQPAQTANPLDNLRIRGTTDALLIAPTDPLFKTTAGATVSYSENGPTKTTTNVLQAAIGYDFRLESASHLTTFDLIPFVAVDRNMSVVSNKQSPSSRENVMLGATGSMTNLFPGPGGASDANTLSFTYEHIWNDIDGSAIEFIHFLDQPIIGPFFGKAFFINSYIPISNGAPLGQELVGFTPLFDLRGDLGFYSAQGTANPSTTRNYQQIGSRFGIDVAFPRIKSDLTITQILMAELQNSRKGISYFDVEWTYNITDNAGLKASYQNGNLETTGQRVQQWLLSLSFRL